ncbi:hypothetical protein [Streptomyces sp. CoT10]|uniref:hypothetical protein n=1 Tax=Streptomyces sp. CoT10 TaxID=2875762 RepID=UPI001CD305D8|nr:hypothetical protein [Streptomyces sp. CoT10]
MVFVAVLLLPLVSVLLVVMDRVEERMLDPAPTRGRHAGRRAHLRLLPGGRRGTGSDAGPVAPAPDPAAADERRRAA